VVGHNKWMLPQPSPKSILSIERQENMQHSSACAQFESKGQHGSEVGDVESGQPKALYMEGSSSSRSSSSQSNSNRVTRCSEIGSKGWTQACKAWSGVVWILGLLAWWVWASLVWMREYLKMVLLKFVTNVWDGTDEEHQQSGGGEVRSVKSGVKFLATCQVALSSGANAMMV